MYELISNLILYGNLPEDEILVQLAKLLSDDEKSNHEMCIRDRSCSVSSCSVSTCSTSFLNSFGKTNILTTINNKTVNKI